MLVERLHRAASAVRVNQGQVTIVHGVAVLRTAHALVIGLAEVKASDKIENRQGQYDYNGTQNIDSKVEVAHLLSSIIAVLTSRLPTFLN